MGVSSYTIEETSTFNSKKIELLTALNEENVHSREKFDYVSGTLNAKHGVPINYPEMTVTTFGDSIIISWNFENGIPPEFIFSVVTFWIENAISLGIQHHILLRGAISLKCLIDNSDIVNTTSNTTIIGPAIADANAGDHELIGLE